MERSVRSSKAAFWQQVLEEYRQSNLSVAAFCSQKSLSVQSFYQWRRKLQPDHQVRDVQNLVPVRIITAPPQVRSETSSSLHIMTPSGFSVRFDAAVQPQQVTKILEAIELASRGESC